MRAVEIMYVLAEAERPIMISELSVMSGEREVVVKEALVEWDTWLCKTSDKPPKFSPTKKLRVQLEYENFKRSANINLKSIRKQIADNMWENIFD